MRVSPHIQGEAWVAATGRDAPALAPDCGTSLQGSGLRDRGDVHRAQVRPSPTRSAAAHGKSPRGLRTADAGVGLPQVPQATLGTSRREAPRTPYTAVTAVDRMSHDLFLAQHFARHVSPLTTTICTHASDEEMYQRVRGLSC